MSFRLAAGLVLLMLALVGWVPVPSGAQSPAAAPAFQTASVRPSSSRGTGASYAGLDDGSVLISNMSVMAMVADAYGIDETIAQYLLTGDDPLLSDRFNVSAKGPASASRDQRSEERRVGKECRSRRWP